MNFNATEYFKQAALGLMRQPLPNITLPGPSKINPHNMAAGIVPKKRPDIVPQMSHESSNALAAPLIKKTSGFNGFSALAYFAALG